MLRPAHIDRFSGYRYYEISQLLTLNRILALKDLDFSLDQIKELLTVNLSGEVMQNLLQRKAVELQGRILDDHSRLIRVEEHLAQLQKDPGSRNNPVVLKSSIRQWVAAVRQVLPSAKDLAEWQQEQLAFIDHNLQKAGICINEPTILILHQDEYREVDVDVEVGRFLLEIMNKFKSVQDHFKFIPYQQSITWRRQSTPVVRKTSVRPMPALQAGRRPMALSPSVPGAK